MMSQPTGELPLSSLVGALESSMTRVVRMYRKVLQENARQHGLSRTQLTAMRLIACPRGRRMSELAEYLDLTAGACTALIERLRERGLVERGVDPHDGRVVLVLLTPEGQQLLDATLEAFRRHLEERLAELSIVERYVVLGGMEALARVLTESPESC